MERSFAQEIESLRLGSGQLFAGEGVLAVTKALLQAGVSYVGGYQGSPVSHLLDVMVQARDYLDELGVHVETCTTEVAAAAMLGASINYPVRGAVTWKTIVGTNVAADALSNLASAGVKGGALIIAGDDYGEGSSIIQERTHAFAMKSSIWLLDPRPNLPSMVRMVEKGFELSEASNSPVMVDLRVRACHLQGTFVAKDNRRPAHSCRRLLEMPAEFDYGRLAQSPSTFEHERLKAEVRMPAARRFVRENALNEHFDGPEQGLGIIVQGGLHNNLMRALQLMGLADSFGRARIPILALNVVYPLVPEEVNAFCARKQAVLVLEEGHPEFIEHEIAAILRRSGAQARLRGKDCLRMAGEYTTEVIVRGLVSFLREHARRIDVSMGEGWIDGIDGARRVAAQSLGAPLPARPPGLCIGCPERPVFSALKLIEREVGKPHLSADIGCHAFVTFEPFSMGNSILGYGMGLASAAGVAPMMARRPVSLMGDGGFWHNGLLSGVASQVLNRGDSILVILKNGYTSATGTQELVSSPSSEARAIAREKSAVHADKTIESALSSVGVKWQRTVHTYRIAETMNALREAFRTPEPGLKVIVAEGECQLERQRRTRPVIARLLKQGGRVVRKRFGVDEDVCSGDHSCIRLSGCPSLTVKTSADPLKVDPVAHVDNSCVGCGVCGEVAHAAVLCPSFYRAEIIQNPSRWDRRRYRLRRWVIGMLQRP